MAAYGTCSERNVFSDTYTAKRLQTWPLPVQSEHGLPPGSRDGLRPGIPLGKEGRSMSNTGAAPGPKGSLIPSGPPRVASARIYEASIFQDLSIRDQNIIDRSTSNQILAFSLGQDMLRPGQGSQRSNVRPS